MLDLTGHCMAYCSHGGICELEAGHEGLHDTHRCQFSDEEALTREEADEVLMRIPGGERGKLLWDMFIPQEESERNER